MAGFGYCCAVVLAGVFVWAGTAKAARPRETAAGFAALGVPAAAAAARAVPAVELLLAVCILAAPRVGGVAALVLLAAFSVVLGRAVRQGVTAGCNCFGTARVEPVSVADLIRNGLLALLGAAALLPRQPTVPNVVAVVTGVVVVAVGAAVLRAARRSSRWAGGRWQDGDG